MDADKQAVERALTNEIFKNRAHVYHGNFVDLGKLPQKKFDAILFDLGLSSDQLKDKQRGFSFLDDGPMDMRMDTTSGRSSEEFLETATRAELISAIRDYGEEVLWKKVVSTIELARGTGKLSRTSTFAELVRRAVHNYRT
jgi:16S rRNA (cytosine1402-N4)-methyltransferase